MPLVVAAERNGGATGEGVIAESRLPVPGHGELCAVQELGLIQKSSGEIGAIKYCLEEVRSLQMGTRQVRLAQICSSEIGTSEIGLGEIEPAQIEPS